MAFINQRTPYVATSFIHYNSPDIFLGVAIEVLPKDQSLRDPTKAQKHVMDQLRGGPNVRKVYPSRYVTLLRPVGNEMDRAVSRRSLAPLHSTDFAIRATLNSTTDALPAHVATGVSIQHLRGNFGAGVRACVGQ